MRIVHKLISEIKSKGGWYVILGIVAAGFALYLLGKFLEHGLVPGQTSFLASALTGIGSLISISGVSGAVMKILAVEGFFLDAVAEDAHGPRGLDRLNDEKLHETWIHSTR